MPSLWNIGCTVEDDKALDLGCNYVADTGARSLPCKDCDPSYVMVSVSVSPNHPKVVLTLHPCHEGPYARRGEKSCPLNANQPS